MPVTDVYLSYNKINNPYNYFKIEIYNVINTGEYEYDVLGHEK